VGTPVLTTTSTHPSPPSPTTYGASGEIVVPVVPLAFRARSLPTHHFSILANASFLSLPPVPPLSIDTPCHFFFFFLFYKCRSVGHSHRSAINHYSTSPLHSTHLLTRHGYCVHMRPPLVCIASVQCFGRRQGGRYDIASCSYDH
jgi:hypothetical protein